MKTKSLLICLCVYFFYTCKNSSTNNQDTYAGEYPFEKRQYDMIADPPVALQDTIISFKVTCYPKFTGTGWMAISLGASVAWVVLEFPDQDTLKDYKEVRHSVRFQGKKPFTQEWRFKLLKTFSNDYSIAVMAAYDSIFIADSIKMYPIESPELKKIKWIGTGGPLQYFTLPKP